MRLIHKDRGKVVAIEERAFVDGTVEVPRRRQRLSGVASFYARNTHLVPLATLSRASTYQPGPFLQIASDGCRFTISDGVMCGAKSLPGKAWCACHHKIVYEPGGSR